MLALIIFTPDSSYKLVFPSDSLCCSFLERLSSLCPNLSPPSVMQASLESQWKSKAISNFAYLMALNHLSGRTQHDLGQYPIFPWLVNQYDSPSLVLDTSSLRELNKPIGLQNKFNKQKLSLLKEKKGRSFLFN